MQKIHIEDKTRRGSKVDTGQKGFYCSHLCLLSWILRGTEVPVWVSIRMMMSITPFHFYFNWFEIHLCHSLTLSDWADWFELPCPHSCPSHFPKSFELWGKMDFFCNIHTITFHLSSFENAVGTHNLCPNILCLHFDFWAWFHSRSRLLRLARKTVHFPGFLTI